MKILIGKLKYFMKMITQIFSAVYHILYGETYIRCCLEHEVMNDEITTLYYETLDNHVNNERINVHESATPRCMSDNKAFIIVTIPVVFHLVDTELEKQNHQHWISHVQERILHQINQDFNTNYETYAPRFISDVEKLFADADISKKNYYLNLAKSLPLKDRVKWEFLLRDVVMKPIPNVTIEVDNNDHIFRKLELIDPETHLNIVIAPARQILGRSIFPFQDRHPLNPKFIDPLALYKSAILINTRIFLGTLKPYDKFRTFTHEIGHWCGLLHVFEDPLMLKEQDSGSIRPTHGTVYDKVTYKHECVNGKIKRIKYRKTPYAYIFESNHHLPNFHNFMDYTDDQQMCMFTAKQICHMIYMLNQYRPSFINQSIDKKNKKAPEEKG